MVTIGGIILLKKYKYCFFLEWILLSYIKLTVQLLCTTSNGVHAKKRCQLPPSYVAPEEHWVVGVYNQIPDISEFQPLLTLPGSAGTKVKTLNLWMLEVYENRFFQS